MKFAVACVCLFAVVATMAAVPSTPVFPTQFSTTVYVVADFNTSEAGVGRWFFDAKLKKSRTDFAETYHGKTGLAVSIMDRVNDVDISLYYIADDVYCSEFNSSWVPPADIFDFSDFTFAGTAMIAYIPVNVWYFQNSTSGESKRFYDNVANREPVRFVYDDPESQKEFSWTFIEMDESPQDPNLFILPAPIQAICDNRA